MKVYDCFTFYNEFELLELRFMALWDAVDYFVIVEANRKHNGEPKDFDLPKRAEEFKKFWPKIRYINADLSNVPYTGASELDWSIEIAQRNTILRGIDDAQPDDLIFISDLDEIPDPNILQRLQENRVALIAPQVLPLTVADKSAAFPAQLLVPAAQFLDFGAIAMRQEFIMYYFDWLAGGVSWRGTVLTKRKNLTMPQVLRDLRLNVPYVPDGGYHFTYMGGIDRVVNKMTSIVDGNERVVQSGGKLLDRKIVEEAMMNGTDVYSDNPELRLLPEKLSPYDVRNINLPHLDEFLRKYPHFLREPEKYFGENFNGATDL